MLGTAVGRGGWLVASHFLNYDTVLETKKVYVGNGHGWVIIILGVKFMEVENFFESILGSIYQEYA